MKKYFIGLVAAFALFLTGCSGDAAVNPTEVYNGLVSKMDAVVYSQETFFNTYSSLEEGVSAPNDLVTHFEQFKQAVSELDAYFTTTKFHSSQQPIVDFYNNGYKAFLQGYVTTGDAFVSAVTANGLDLEGAELVAVNEYISTFIEKHDELVALVTQAKELL